MSLAFSYAMFAIRHAVRYSLSLFNIGKRQGTVKSDSEWRGEWRMARRLANGELRMANGEANIEYRSGETKLLRQAPDRSAPGARETYYTRQDTNSIPHHNKC